MKRWIKIGSKASTFLARDNGVRKCINQYMREFSGMPKLLWNYKYIDQTHYGPADYLQQLEILHRTIHRSLGGVQGYIRRRKKEFSRCLTHLRELNHGAHTIGNDYLAERILAADDLYARTNSYLGLGTLYTDYLHRTLLSKFGDRYRQLTFDEPTALSDYQREVARVSAATSQRVRLALVKKTLRRYYWLGSFFFIGNELSVRQILEDAKNYQPVTKSLRRPTTSLRHPLVTEMRLLSHDRNREAEDFMHGEYWYRRLLMEASRRLLCPFKTIVALTVDEVVACLHGARIPSKKAAARLRLYGFLIENGQAASFDGRRAEKLREPRMCVTAATVLRGQTAFASKKIIRGRVNIVENSSDLMSFNDKEILVTHMTTPNYVPAMRKAAAVVTDEGGMTCHAAIVSRELRIPCIVGTKVATQVLKDGMTVEVLASRGMVKIVQ